METEKVVAWGKELDGTYYVAVIDLCEGRRNDTQSPETEDQARHLAGQIAISRQLPAVRMDVRKWS